MQSRIDSLLPVVAPPVVSPSVIPAPIRHFLEAVQTTWLSQSPEVWHATCDHIYDGILMLHHFAIEEWFDVLQAMVYWHVGPQARPSPTSVLLCDYGVLPDEEIHRELIAHANDKTDPVDPADGAIVAAIRQYLLVIFGLVDVLP